MKASVKKIVFDILSTDFDEKDENGKFVEHKTYPTKHFKSVLTLKKKLRNEVQLTCIEKDKHQVLEAYKEEIKDLPLMEQIALYSAKEKELDVKLTNFMFADYKADEHPDLVAISTQFVDGELELTTGEKEAVKHFYKSLENFPNIDESTFEAFITEFEL